MESHLDESAKREFSIVAKEEGEAIKNHRENCERHDGVYRVDRMLLKMRGGTRAGARCTVCAMKAKTSE